MHKCIKHVMIFTLLSDISQKFQSKQLINMPCKPLYCICGSYTIPQRYVLCFMAFLAVFICYALRTCLHIAITEMVVPPVKQNSSKVGSYCPDDQSGAVEVHGGVHNWTEKQQGAILAAFFFGYMTSHMPGGFMADKYGAKHVLSGGILISALFTFLTPVTVNNGGDWWSLVIIRLLVGFGQGPLYPCLATIQSRWVPLKERTTLGAIMNTGNMLGSILGNLLSSLIMAYIDWPTVFYFWGVMSIIWYVFFIILCYSEPSQHPYITPEEAEMLNTDIGPKQNLKVPWKKIMSDPVNWALLFGEVGHDWIFYLIIVQLPSYLKNVLHFNVTENGILNALPYLCLWICSVGTGIIADYCIMKKGFSILRMRQIYTFVGNVGPGVCVLLASVMGCDRMSASAMFCLGMFLMGPFFSGMKINVLDVTKNFAGIIMAIVNGVGALMFFPVPYLMAFIIVNQSIEEWKTVFILIFIGCSVSTIIYLLFTSDKRADWDKE